MKAALIERLRLALVAVCLLSSTAMAQSRDAAAVLCDFDAVSYPSMSSGSDPEALAKFEAEIRAAAERQQALAQELLLLEPRHERTAEVMRTRWTLFCTVQKDAERVLEETAALDTGATKELRRAAAGVRALAAATVWRAAIAARVRIVREALEAAPGDDYVGTALVHLAMKETASIEQQREILAILETSFAANEAVAGDMKTIKRLNAAVGKPFTLAFPKAATHGDGAVPESTEAWVDRAVLLFFDFEKGDYISESDRDQVHTWERFAKLEAAERVRVLTIVECQEKTAAKDVFANARKRSLKSALYADSADFETSILRRNFRVARSNLAILVEKGGRLAAWTFRPETLFAEFDRLSAAPKKRRI